MFLLINPGNFSIGVNEVTVLPPVGLVSIATVLNKNGFKAEVYDANFGNAKPKEALKVIEARKPKVIGIRVYLYNISWTKILIEGARRIDPEIIVGIGGHLASHNPKEAIAKTSADFAIRGEGEMSMLALAKNISKNFKFYENVAGIVAKTDNEYYFGPQNIRIKNLDELPFADYDLIGGLKKYSFRAAFAPAAPLFTTRGCPFRCSFCSKHVFGDIVTFRSPENVISEISQLKGKYKIRQIDILDDNFTVNKKYFEKILDLVIENNLDIKFDLKCGVRVESLSEDVLMKMKKAGFFKIAFGIESADEKVLQLCNKQLDLNKLKKMASFAKQIGFKTFGFFIIGLPGETRESVEASVQLAKDIKLDVANFCMATPYPGTELYDYINEYGEFLFDPQSNYDFGFYGRKVFYSLPGMDEKEILSRFEYAYRRFYSLPKIIKCCSQIRSISELKWFFNAALSTVKSKFHKSRNEKEKRVSV